MVPERSGAARQHVIRKTVRAFIDMVSRPRVYLAILAVFIALFAWMEIPVLPYSAADFATHTNGGSALDMKIGYSPGQAYELLSGYGADGRAYYVSKLLINDTVFPIAYSLLFAATLALLLKYLARPDSRLRYLALLPLAGGILDLLENMGIISMLLSYPARADWIATVTSLVTMVKLGVNVTAMLLIAACLAAALYQLVGGIFRRGEVPR